MGLDSLRGKRAFITGGSSGSAIAAMALAAGDHARVDVFGLGSAELFVV